MGGVPACTCVCARECACLYSCACVCAACTLLYVCACLCARVRVYVCLYVCLHFEKTPAASGRHSRLESAVWEKEFKT